MIPVVTGLAALYVVLILFSCFFNPRVFNLPFVAFSVATLTALLVLRYLANQQDFPPRRLELVGTVATGFVLINALLYIFLSSEYQESLNLILFVLGILSFFLSSTRLSLVLLVSLVAWILVESVWGSTTAWLHFTFGLFVGAGLKVPFEFRKDEVEQTWQELQTSEERYALAAMGSNDGLWDWDLVNNEISHSSRWEVILGIEDGGLGSSPKDWFDRIHPLDLPALQAALDSHLQGKSPHLEHEYRIRHENGNYVWILTRGIAIQKEGNKPHRLAGSHTEITDRKGNEQRLYYGAFHDSLTSLPNRALFLENLARALAKQKRNPDYVFSVLFADLDRFKVINDSLGHLSGDLLLKATSERLSQTARTTDLVSRFAGDEFAILVEDMATTSDSKHYAIRIQETLAEVFEVEGRKVFTSASIGIVISKGQYDDPNDLLRDADTAMYHAKRAGGSRCEVFTNDMHEAVRNTLQLETGLRLALRERQFVLHYQPIFSADTREVVAAEALLRWDNPEEGLLLPGDFLTTMEESGLIVPIGRWILRQACRDIDRLGRIDGCSSDIPVQVNISPAQFAQPDFALEVLECLFESRLSPSQLRLEIGEQCLTDTGEAALSKLQQLRAGGIQIYLDRFGTGQSSLAQLNKLPINGVKLDHSFTSQMERVEIRALSDAILKMAQIFNLDVTAQGLETKEQLELLDTQQCSFLQGTYFARPMCYEALEVFMTNHSKGVEDSNIVKFAAPKHLSRPG